MGDFSIGQLAAAAETKVQTIRYYEEIGVMPRVARTGGGQRRYASGDLKRLAFIRHARDLGFSIEAIRTLLGLQDRPDHSCEAADAIAGARLAEVEQRIAKLEALRAELKRMLASCRHGKVAECRVIEVLADHGQCAHEAH